jgi:hypothetical protein
MGKAAANGRVTLGIRRRIPTQGNDLPWQKKNVNEHVVSIFLRDVRFLQW